MQYYDSVTVTRRDQEAAGGPATPPSGRMVCRRGSWPPCRPEPHCDTQILFTAGAGGPFRIQSDCVSEVGRGPTTAGLLANLLDLKFDHISVFQSFYCFSTSLIPNFFSSIILGGLMVYW